jgi:hypothetical protein
MWDVDLTPAGIVLRPPSAVILAREDADAGTTGSQESPAVSTALHHKAYRSQEDGMVERVCSSSGLRTSFFLANTVLRNRKTDALLLERAPSLVITHALA